MSNGSDKSAAQLEREINDDRSRIEKKLNAIQERLTPGQMIDEALGYMKSRGATEYFANLGNAAKANPMPLALMGIGMAWLMASPTQQHARDLAYDRSDDFEDYPLATVTGSVRRTRPAYLENGRSYSDFVDDSGKQFKALTDETGRRAGYFADEAGRYFRGFADSTGQTIHDIRDETGAMFDQASGWASDTWRAAKDSLRGMTDSLSGAADSVRQGSSSAMDGLRHQSGHLNDLITRQFRDQPLVGGALAFAIGAAIGAALPHTRQEDEMLGETADEMRRKAADQASDMIDKGAEVAKDVYDKAAAVASDVHDSAKERIMEETQTFTKRGDGPGNGLPTAH
jgi:hypothetical protein